MYLFSILRFARNFHFFLQFYQFSKFDNFDRNTTIHAGIIHNTWKILTGDAGHSGFYKNHTVIPNPYPAVHLFDLASDPLELVNVAEYFPSIVTKMLKMLRDFDDGSAPIDSPGYDEENVYIILNSFFFDNFSSKRLILI